ncbi:MAG: hypothetical protein AB7O96_01465 [Pseudobdellovibrionaceae bacterium]
MDPKKLRLFIFSFFAFHLLLSQLVLPIAKTTEFFPFFTWDLFSNSEKIETLYEIEIEDPLTGKKCIFPNCPYNFKTLKNKNFFFLIRSAGISYSDNDSTEKAEQMEKMLKDVIQGPFIYNLYRTKIDLTTVQKIEGTKEELLKGASL